MTAQRKTKTLQERQASLARKRMHEMVVCSHSISALLCDLRLAIQQQDTSDILSTSAYLETDFRNGLDCIERLQDELFYTVHPGEGMGRQ